MDLIYLGLNFDLPRSELFFVANLTSLPFGPVGNILRVLVSWSRPFVAQVPQRFERKTEDLPRILDTVLSVSLRGPPQDSTGVVLYVWNKTSVTSRRFQNSSFSSASSTAGCLERPSGVRLRRLLPDTPLGHTGSGSRVSPTFRPAETLFSYDCTRLLLDPNSTSRTLK